MEVNRNQSQSKCDLHVMYSKGLHHYGSKGLIPPWRVTIKSSHLWSETAGYPMSCQSIRLGLWLSHRQDVGTTCRWPRVDATLQQAWHFFFPHNESLFMNPAGAPASPDEIQIKDDESVSKGRSRFVIISYDILWYRLSFVDFMQLSKCTFSQALCQSAR